MKPDDDEQAAVRAAHERWMEAVNAGDLDEMLARLTDDVVLINPWGEPLVGREPFAARFSGAVKRERIRCESELLEVVVVGDFAYTRSRDTVSATPIEGGKETKYVGHRLTIYRKSADGRGRGRWLLARDANAMGEEKENAE
jgi:uncharacterized protein (TIGR02246 family)